MSISVLSTIVIVLASTTVAAAVRRQRLDGEIIPVGVELSSTCNVNDYAERFAAAHAVDLDQSTQSRSCPADISIRGGTKYKPWIKLSIGHEHCIHQVVSYISTAAIHDRRYTWTCTETECFACEANSGSWKCASYSLDVYTFGRTGDNRIRPSDCKYGDTIKLTVSEDSWLSVNEIAIIGRKVNVAQIDCPAEYVICSDAQRCIRESWVCNGKGDCSGDTDEDNCEEHTCMEDHRKCSDGKTCIADSSICDVIKDCPDGDDEEDCEGEVEVRGGSTPPPTEAPVMTTGPVSFSLIDSNGAIVGATILGLLIANGGTVCKNKFNTNTADTICRKMGYVGQLSWTYGWKWRDIQSPLDIALTNVECSSGEWSSCSFTSEHKLWSHYRDVFLQCAGFGWIAVPGKRGDMIDYDIEATPLEIRTDSTLKRSGDKVDLYFFTSQGDVAGGIQIFFTSTPQYYISYCSLSKTNFPTNLPSDIQKVWRIALTRTPETRLQIHCNNVEMVNVLINSATCSLPDWTAIWNNDLTIKIIEFTRFADTASDLYRQSPGSSK